MQFSSLGSGSRGNATLIECDGTTILVDCGFSVKETEKRLARLKRNPEQLAAILVTHEHGDHARGVLALASKYGIPIWSSPGTAKAAQFDHYTEYHVLDIHQAVAIDSVQVTPVAVPHDAREPCQFIFSDGDWKLGLLTDTGSSTPHIEEQYSGCHALLLEANHDEQMLQDGPYPPSLKQRVAGRFGHLSNNQAASILQSIATDRLKYLFASHISEKNNTEALARYALSEALCCDMDWVRVAEQEQGFDWCVLRHEL